MDLNPQLLQLLSKFYNLTGISITTLRSFCDANLHVSCDQGEYVAKVLSDSSEVTDGFLKEQFRVMQHLSDKGYHCSCPIKDSSGSYINKIDIRDSRDGVEAGHYRVALFSYIRGSELVKLAPLSAPLLQLSGSLVAHLRTDMKDLPYSRTSCISAGNNPWSLENLAGLRDHVHIVKDSSDRKLVNDVITSFENSVVPVLDELEKGIIHGDIHDDNLIILPSSSICESTDTNKNTPVCDTVITKDTVSGPTTSSQVMLKQDPKQVLGLIDFGDMSVSRYIFELAITIAYLTMFSKQTEFVNVGRAVLQGYTSRKVLYEREMEVLFLSVCGRYCQELILCQLEAERQEENTEGSTDEKTEKNTEYLRCGLEDGWPQLRLLWSMGEEKVMSIWKDLGDNGDGEL